MTGVLRSRGRCVYKPRTARGRRLSAEAGREPGADPPPAPARCGQGWLVSPRGRPFLPVCALKSSSSKDSSPVGLGFTLGTSFYLNYPFKDPVSKDTF